MDARAAGSSAVCFDPEGTAFLPLSAVARLSPPMFVSLLAFVPPPSAAAVAADAAADAAASRRQLDVFSVSLEDLRWATDLYSWLSPFLL